MISRASDGSLHAMLWRGMAWHFMAHGISWRVACYGTLRKNKLDNIIDYGGDDWSIFGYFGNASLICSLISYLELNRHGPAANTASFGYENQGGKMSLQNHTVTKRQ